MSVAFQRLLAGAPQGWRPWLRDLDLELALLDPDWALVSVSLAPEPSIVVRVDPARQPDADRLCADTERLLAHACAACGYLTDNAIETRR